MPAPLKEDYPWLFAVLLSLAALSLPISNPDLFWHLSAGRWMIDYRIFPRTDFLSFTALGRPWLDFEWLFQIICQGLYSIGGFGSLWVLKLLLLVESALALDATLRLHAAGRKARAAALAFWSAGMINYADIRPELFSLAFLSLLFYLLERRRLESRGEGRGVWGESLPQTSVSRPSFSASLLADCGTIFLLFVLWSNIHAGFLVGLGILFLYIGVDLVLAPHPSPLAPLLLVAALAGTLLNPYGLGPYQVALDHWRAQNALSKDITEWLPMSLNKPFHWPYFAQLAIVSVTLIAAARRFARKRRTGSPGAENWKAALAALPIAAILCAAGFGFAALLHARLAAYFGITAIPAVFLTLQELGFTDDWTFTLGLFGWEAVYAAYLLVLLAQVSWAWPFNFQRQPVLAANFLEQNQSEISGLRLYNQWEWGGYLGWRLWPWYKVSSDGRYIFHDQLAQAVSAAENEEAWQKFTAENRFDGALLPNLGRTFPTTKEYSDGSTKPFQRPWYLFYMPKDRWALVYWDNLSLLFIRRDAASPQWLSQHEYRYVHPFDQAAFAEALARHEIPAQTVQAEEQRHALEQEKWH